MLPKKKHNYDEQHNKATAKEICTTTNTLNWFFFELINVVLLLLSCQIFPFFFTSHVLVSFFFLWLAFETCRLPPCPQFVFISIYVIDMKYLIRSNGFPKIDEKSYDFFQWRRIIWFTTQHQWCASFPF